MCDFGRRCVTAPFPHAGPWVGEQKTLGKSHLGGNPNPGMTYLPTFGFHAAIPDWGVRVCVFVCALSLYPANPGPGSRCVCVSFGYGFHPANPGWGVWACGFVCALCLHPASPGWGVWCGCVCLGAGFGCPPPLPAGV